MQWSDAGNYKAQIKRHWNFSNGNVEVLKKGGRVI